MAYVRKWRTGAAVLSALAFAAVGGSDWLAAARPTLVNREATPKKVAADRPNILFVLADDLGAQDLGYTGSRLYESPNLDAFASRGADFSAAYSPSPVCSPSRAAIMTGKDPARLGITTWFPGGEYTNMPLIEPKIPEHLPLAEKTIAEALQTVGYRTFYAGKWHLGGKSALPSAQGFDISIGGGEYGQPPRGYYSPYGNAYLSDGPKGEYLDDRLTDETIRFLSTARAGKAPFFAFLSLYSVHTPIQPAPGTTSDRFKAKAAQLARPGQVAEKVEGVGRTKLVQDNGAYASMVYRMDHNFGRLMATLDRLGLRRNTIVVFTSDNGGLSTLDPRIDLYAKGTPTSNAPLRAGKGWTYEGGIRVPLLIAGPGVSPRRVGSPVVLTDLYATLLDLANVGRNERAPADSVNLSPLLKSGKTGPSRTLFWHYPHYHGSGSKPATAIRRGEWKLVRNYESDSWELFNLARDPGEERNVAAQYPVQMSSLRRELQRVVDQTSARMPVRRL